MAYNFDKGRLSLQGYIDKQLKWARAHKLTKKQRETWLKRELLRSSIEAATAIAVTIGAAYFIPQLELAWAEYVRRGMVSPTVEPVGRFKSALGHTAKPGGYGTTLPYWKQAGYVAPDVWREGLTGALKAGSGALREGIKGGLSLGVWGSSGTLKNISPLLAPAIFGLSFALTQQYTEAFDWVKRQIDPSITEREINEELYKQYRSAVMNKTYMSGLTPEQRQQIYRNYETVAIKLGHEVLPYPYHSLDTKETGIDMTRYEEAMQFGKAQQVLNEDQLALAYDALPEQVKNNMAEVGIDKTMYVGYMRMKQSGVPTAFLNQQFPQFTYPSIDQISDRYMTYSDVMNLILDNEISESPEDLPLYDIPEDEIEFPWKSKKYFSYKE